MYWCCNYSRSSSHFLANTNDNKCNNTDTFVITAANRVNRDNGLSTIEDECIARSIDNRISDATERGNEIKGTRDGNFIIITIKTSYF